ncbi:MAG: hypothetical protein ACKVWR_07915 [Acidimicrobiales bacterium]
MSLQLDDPPLRFHALSVLDEGGDDVVIGRTDIDSYAIFPRDGAALIEELKAGRSPAEAGEWYEQQFGDQVDIDDFLATLHDLEFVGTAEPAPPAGPVRWQRLGAALFSPFAWLVYLVIVAEAVAAAWFDPRLAPQQGNVFFSRYLVLVELTVLVGQSALALVHEAFHVLAGRRLGVRSRLRISHRFYFVVFETALNGLVVVPRRRRYLPLLAGMLADVLVVALLTLAAALSRRPDGSIPLWGGVCLALAFTTIPRIAWQGYFFLRTDVYHLIATAFGCVDLHNTSRQWLANRLHDRFGLPRRRYDEAAWSPVDARCARWYGPLAALGYTLAVAVAVLVVLPVTLRFFGAAAARLFDPGSSSAAEMADSAVLLTLTAAQFALAGVLAVRERRSKERR